MVLLNGMILQVPSTLPFSLQSQAYLRSGTKARLQWVRDDWVFEDSFIEVSSPKEFRWDLKWMSRWKLVKG